MARQRFLGPIFRPVFPSKPRLVLLPLLVQIRVDYFARINDAHFINPADQLLSLNPLEFLFLRLLRASLRPEHSGRGPSLFTGLDTDPTVTGLAWLVSDLRTGLLRVEKLVLLSRHFVDVAHVHGVCAPFAFVVRLHYLFGLVWLLVHLVGPVGVAARDMLVGFLVFGIASNKFNILSNYRIC